MAQRKNTTGLTELLLNGEVKKRAEYEHPKFLIMQPNLLRPDDT